jgi:hypothetical protein
VPAVDLHIDGGGVAGLDPQPNARAPDVEHRRVEPLEQALERILQGRFSDYARSSGLTRSW